MNPYSYLARRVLETLREKKMMIATAESCTGGMIASALTDIPGSSDVVDRGFVTYSNVSKVEMLGVKAEDIKAEGAVSEIVARQMADGALARSHAQIAVSVTGVAGPAAEGKKPVGLVWFGLAIKGEPTVTEVVKFGQLSRDTIRVSTTEHILLMILSAVHEPEVRKK